MHGNKACCEDVYQTAATVSIFVLVICFASTQRTDGQASGVSANELARRILMNELEAEQRDQSHWSFRLETQKPNGQTEADEVVETQNGDLKRPLLINARALTAEQQQKSDKRIRSSCATRPHFENRSTRRIRMPPAASACSKCYLTHFISTMGSAEMTSYS